MTIKRLLGLDTSCVSICPMCMYCALKKTVSVIIIVRCTPTVSNYCLLIIVLLDITIHVAELHKGIFFVHEGYFVYSIINTDCHL